MPRRFNARPETIQRELIGTMKRMKATSLRVNPGQDILNPTREAKIVFDRAGKRYVFTCAHFEHPDDNLRAAQRAITGLYQIIEDYGVTRSPKALDETFAQFFAGWAATPDDGVLMLGSGKSPWWEVLGVEQSASVADIRNAYRALAQIHHPDHGGKAEDFSRLRDAYDRAMKEPQ